jgi:hypothetical protein
MKMIETCSSITFFYKYPFCIAHIYKMFFFSTGKYLSDCKSIYHIFLFFSTMGSTARI